MESSTEARTGSRHDRCMLVIMAKAPRAGLVKTRLSSSLPPAAAADFYRCLLQDTMALVRSLSAVEIAVMCPAPDVEALRLLSRDDVSVVAQTGAGLAAGLTSVFARFAAGGEHVVAFNSDSPHLPGTVLNSAFETLEAHDVVVGPTHDGGYYLVGAKAAHPTLFDDDGMGTKSALDALLGRARALNLSVGFTEPFYDIDVEGDLTRLAAELKSEPGRAPHTAAWLKAWEGLRTRQPATGNKEL